MSANDDAGYLNACGARTTFASRLAPTEGGSGQSCPLRFSSTLTVAVVPARSWSLPA